MPEQRRRSPTTARLAEIRLHPVKSTAIRPVQQAYVGANGVDGDRKWMVVDGDGDAITARELGSLFHICADNPETGGPSDVALRLTARGADAPGPIEVPLPGGDGTDSDDGADDPAARVFGTPRPGRAAGPAVDDWLRTVLGRDDVRLVRSAADPSAGVAFQDESPVSLATTASVAQLAAWLPEPLPVDRFRPNLVVDGELDPFAEDGWEVVRIGPVVLRRIKLIGRCVMTTVDPVTLERGKEPIRTLAQHRLIDGKTRFAIHLRVERPGTIAVGDEVTCD